MDADLKAAYLIAEALTKGLSVEELSRLQVTLQTLCSLVGGELALARLRGSTATLEKGAGK